MVVKPPGSGMASGAISPPSTKRLPMPCGAVGHFV
jgi:hypothetical protein